MEKGLILFKQAAVDGHEEEGGAGGSDEAEDGDGGPVESGVFGAGVDGGMLRFGDGVHFSFCETFVEIPECAAADEGEEEKGEEDGVFLFHGLVGWVKGFEGREGVWLRSRRCSIRSLVRGNVI
jgi:hypothetical protein